MKSLAFYDSMVSLDLIQRDEPSLENSNKEKEIKAAINKQWEKLEMIWK